MRLPTAIVIGAPRCGTTSLHRLLGQHPDICVSLKKEPNYFMWPGNSQPPLENYAELFQRDAKAYMEFSTTYSFVTSSPVPERIAAALPACRIIYLVRDPLERIISHYRYAADVRKEKRSFSEAIHPQMVLASRYNLNLRRWLRHFPRESMMVARAERVLADPSALLSFVGVEPIPLPAAPRENPSVSPEPELVKSTLRLLYDEFALVVEDLGRLTGEDYSDWLDNPRYKR
jgi:hypothetical protein